MLIHSGIGQAFSDTTDAIMLDPDTSVEIPDVTRNNRNFTDGVGIISSDLLARVWKEFTRTRREEATLLQVRFRGLFRCRGRVCRVLTQDRCQRHARTEYEASKECVGTSEFYG